MRQYELKRDTCDHTDELVTVMESGPHYAKVTCRKCNRFLRWAPNPESIERREEIKRSIEHMESIGVSEWEKGFLATIRKQGFNMSQKQQAVFDGMRNRFRK